MWVGDLFLKKNFIDQFFRFEISLPWASKQKQLIFPLEKYSKTLKDMINVTAGT